MACARLVRAAVGDGRPGRMRSRAHAMRPYKIGLRTGGFRPLPHSAGEGLGVRVVAGRGRGDSLEKADATGLIDGLGAVRRLQLAEDIAEMFFHRLFADKEVLTNITIRESG